MYVFHSGFENDILDEKSKFHSPEDLQNEVIPLDINRGKETNDSESIIHSSEIKGSWST